ncbi:MAG: hypothetical protein E7773_11310 [Sphingomonas sp.]|uniref:hypothetical protein n=1 Tax=Sphingomonas sp. TaxID=28214 RepID=UPI00121EFAE8|nr:hypothetical protein [Sphingomonas sp.]THD35047.1 MAG: hypothetical protein E7773_11310 [Sphingomonas sp.]
MIRRSLLLLVLLTAGCAEATDKYPSLAPRPIESRPEAEVVTPVTAATPDAALDLQIAGIAVKLAKTDSDFTAAAARADAAARARGAQTTGSDQWLAAQTALADLEALQGDTLGVASDVETMVTARGEAGQPPYPALDALHDKAQAQADAEAAKVAAIRALTGDQ